MISYAQNFEDVMLSRCFADRTNGFYIDVGAMDPTEHSVTKYFYDQGWSGINIEPNDFFFNRLMQERPRDINLKLAVGERDECRTMHVFEQYGISTFDASHRDRFVEQGFEAKERTVRTTTLASICREYVKSEIDFLKVDCEGWETFALRGFDWERFRPIIVIVEATKPLSTEPSWSEWEPVLIEDGRYEMVYFDGLNRFYLRREYRDLSRHFKVPPNVFDEFSIYATHEAHEKLAALTQEVGTLRESAIRLEVVTAENAKLTESVRANERLSGSLDIANARISQLEAQAARQRELEGQLLETRLWVGQLSQDLAATKRR